MTLSVIGAGFGRTGTMSLKLGLETLGVGPCYHMYEVGKRPEHDPMWLAATRRQAVDWDALFTGFNSAVDWPVAGFWRELAEVYPEAKFILTEREPQSWYRSISSTIIPTLQSSPQALQTEHRTMTRELILERTFGGRANDKQHVIDTYLRHNEEVRNTLPAERLLNYETGSGWEPLTTFLGLATPTEPYPQTNSTAEFQQRAAERRRQQAASNN